MNQEKIGKFIRQIRKENNLTQADLAKKYGVTYQAVSKWENGKNIPDIALLKQMSKDFNINIEDLLEGNYSKNKLKKISHTKLIAFFTIIITILLVFIIIIFTKKNDDFSFKTISSSCNSFTISGSLAYNNKKSAIYISNINYCGGTDNSLYSKIECTLYEKDKNTEVKLGEYKHEVTENTTLENLLKNVTFDIHKYDRICQVYQKNTLYLVINVKGEANKTTTYKVPISLNNNCNK